jgi:hypothetical protein
VRAKKSIFSNDIDDILLLFRSALAASFAPILEKSVNQAWRTSS